LFFDRERVVKAVKKWGQGLISDYGLTFTSFSRRVAGETRRSLKKAAPPYLLWAMCEDGFMWTCDCSLW